MKKYICLILVLCILLLCAFIRKTTMSVVLYTDPDTGVEYICYAAGYKGGICPRFNNDGTLKVNYDILK